MVSDKSINRLLRVYGNEAEQVTPAVISLIYENIFGALPPGCTKEPTCQLDDIETINAIIKTLQDEVIQVDLSHIDATKVVHGDCESVLHLIEILAGYVEYILEADYNQTYDCSENGENARMEDYCIKQDESFSPVRREILGNSFGFSSDSLSSVDSDVKNDSAFITGYNEGLVDSSEDILDRTSSQITDKASLIERLNKLPNITEALKAKGLDVMEYSHKFDQAESLVRSPSQDNTDDLLNGSDPDMGYCVAESTPYPKHVDEQRSFGEYLTRLEKRNIRPYKSKAQQSDRNGYSTLERNEVHRRRELISDRNNNDVRRHDSNTIEEVHQQPKDDAPILTGENARQFKPKESSENNVGDIIQSGTHFDKRRVQNRRIGGEKVSDIEANQIELFDKNSDKSLQSRSKKGTRYNTKDDPSAKWDRVDDHYVDNDITSKTEQSPEDKDDIPLSSREEVSRQNQDTTSHPREDEFSRQKRGKNLSRNKNEHTPGKINHDVRTKLQQAKAKITSEHKTPEKDLDKSIKERLLYLLEKSGNTKQRERQVRFKVPNSPRTNTLEHEKKKLEFDMQKRLLEKELEEKIDRAMVEKKNNRNSISKTKTKPSKPRKQKQDSLKKSHKNVHDITPDDIEGSFEGADIDESLLLPNMLEEYPYLQISPHTARNLFSKQVKQINALKNGETERTKIIKKHLREEEKRQELLLRLMKKELEFTTRQNKKKSILEEKRVLKAKMLDRKLTATRVRKYHRDYCKRTKAKMISKGLKDEMMFRELFEKGMKIQKERLLEAKRKAKEQSEHERLEYQKAMSELETFYVNQNELLSKEMEEKQRIKDIRTQEKVFDRSQQKINRRNNMKKEIEKLQHDIITNEDHLHFTEEDFQRALRRLQ